MGIYLLGIYILGIYLLGIYRLGIYLLGIYLFGIYYISRVKVSDLYQSILDHITPFEKTYIKNNLFDYEIDKK